MHRNDRYLPISLLIPFYNEEESIQRTLNLIGVMGKLPDEIIFIDSSSSDKTIEIISHWANVYRATHVSSSVRIISEGTKLPSTSKNLGVSYSKNEFIVFMDCGLKFSADFLERLYYSIQKDNIDAFFGRVCFGASTDLFDSAYSLGVLGGSAICLVGGIYKKSIFSITGPFVSSRAGYDRKWVGLVKNKFIWGSSDSCNISYFDCNFACGARSIAKKVFMYSLHSFEAKNVDHIMTRVALPTFVVVAFFVHAGVGFAALLLRSYYKLYNGNAMFPSERRGRIFLVIPLVVFVYDMLRLTSGIFIFLRLRERFLFRSGRI